MQTEKAKSAITSSIQGKYNLGTFQANETLHMYIF